MREQTAPNRVRGAVLSVLAAVVALSLCMPAAAFAEPTAADKQAEAQAALASLNSMQDSLNKASDDYFTALAELEEAQANMEEAQARIEETNAQIAEVQDKLGDRANSMYRSGNLTFLDLLLGSTTFEDFTTNWDLLNKMNQNDADMVQQSKDLRAEIEAEKEEYARQEAVAAEKTEESKRIKEEAEATVSAMQETYDTLSAEAAELLEQERAAQEAAEAAAAQAVVEQAAREAAAQNNNGGGGGGTPNSSGPTYTEPPYNAVTGNAVVDRAYSYVGNAQYVWGACSPGQFDCSGFVSYCLTGSYTRLGTTYTFLGWQRVSDPQPGDVAVNSGHTGIYIGNNQMIHAAGTGQGVVVGPVQSGMVFVRY
ncbi:coiled-coil domain-containing protein [Raoultibacter phocaeensis]|uniref:coiled-coil domain-containing protein n=1 Tax=Raoultibacter phocaeensis TaxID=2479841 RepID=UPI001118CE72|nr:NlpC/P60 family protein [Raoultibacter phocaeensis]